MHSYQRLLRVPSRSTVLCLALFALVVSSTESSTVTSVPKVKESISPPHGWFIFNDTPPPATTLQLHIFLAQPNFPQLESTLWNMKTDPLHPHYQQHLSKQQVEAFVAPHPDSVSLVDEWLVSEKIDLRAVQRSGAMDQITIKAPLAKVEAMLNTKYYIWKHNVTGQTVLRTTQYSIPEHLDAHIDVIQPSTSFSCMNPARVSSHRAKDPPSPPRYPAGSVIKANGQNVDASCDTAITINCIRQINNAAGVHASGKHNNKIGAAGYLNLWTSLTDYQLFLKNQTTASGSQTFDIVLVNGGTNDQSFPNGESNLDTQYAFGIAEPTPATFWSTGGSPPFQPDNLTPFNNNEPYADWISFVLSQDSIPQTISTSYADDEDTVPFSYAQRVCRGFAQITARGSTLLFASGDHGVGDGISEPEFTQCFTNDGSNKLRFNPAFPASCGYVTSVGATQNVPEVAASYSGGGFSNYFARPQFQDKAVKAFLGKLPNGTYDGLFNRTGRGIPDVSLQGTNFRYYENGLDTGITGTSASTPGFAGLVALINDARLARGLSSLGWLNPLIYQHPDAFNDITAGNNPGCGTQGFNATSGWDPVTGLGTVDFKKLLGILGR